MKNLKELLNDRQANGIFFSTMQKFDDYDESLTEREDVIVISDEAHRSQYGLEEKVDPKTGEIKIGAARRIRNALPNATYIGFTGTPISRSDKSTREVFGNYIDIYDMTQSVEDGATVPISYESRIAEIKLDETVLEKIDDKYWELREQAEEYNIEKSKHELSKMESLLGAPEIIDDICDGRLLQAGFLRQLGAGTDPFLPEEVQHQRTVHALYFFLIVPEKSLFFFHLRCTRL
jgi:type I restriction enzyme R subunit